MKAIPMIIRFVRPVLAVIITVLSFGVVYCLIYREPKPGSQQALYISVGFVLACLNNVVSYYFGSSKDKTDQDQQVITSGMNKNALLQELKSQVDQAESELRRLISEGNPMDSQAVIDQQAKIDKLKTDMADLYKKT